jgi:hypothetical protein
MSLKYILYGEKGLLYIWKCLPLEQQRTCQTFLPSPCLEYFYTCLAVTAIISITTSKITLIITPTITLIITPTITLITAPTITLITAPTITLIITPTILIITSIITLIITPLRHLIMTQIIRPKWLVLADDNNKFGLQSVAFHILK